MITKVGVRTHNQQPKGKGMRKAIFALLLTAVANIASAEWVEVFNTPDGVWYADPSTIRKREDNTAEILELKDFVKPIKVSGGLLSGTQDAWSATALGQFKCESPQFRISNWSSYSERMGKGEVVSRSTDQREWKPVGDHTYQHLLQMAACDDDPVVAFHRIINAWGSPLGARQREAAKLANYREQFRSAKTVGEWQTFISACKTYDPDNLAPQAEKALVVARETQAVQDAAQREREAAQRMRDLQIVKQIGQKICRSMSGTSRAYTGIVALRKPVYADPVQTKFRITAFTEGVNGERIQIRVGSIVSVSPNGATENIEKLDGEPAYVNGGVVWENSADWEPCLNAARRP